MNHHSDPNAPAASRRGWLKALGGLLTGGLLLGRSRPARAEVLSTNGLNPFVGEIMMISWGFAPKGWALCNGQLLPISQNQVLFSLLGTMYGGDGRVNFALPDMRGRIPISDGNGFVLGQRGGESAHTLSVSEMVPHTHGIKSSTDLGTQQVSGTSSPLVHHYLADSGAGAPQYGFDVNASLATTGAGGATVNTSGSLGGSQAHLNLQPYLTINFVIATQGLFPSPTN